MNENQQAYHVTCVMHNTRTSQRMIAYNVKRGTPEYLTLQEDEQLMEILLNHIIDNRLKILAINVCADHLHFTIVCSTNRLAGIVGKLKSMSARAFNLWRGITVPTEPSWDSDTRGHDELRGHDEPRGHAPLSQTSATRGETQNSLWAQKFHRKLIESDEQLHNTLSYITNNRIKHGLPEFSKEIQAKIKAVIISYDDAFKKDI